MREIKFRGWTGNKMHYGWGCLTNENSKCFIVIDENDHYPDPVTLMQFTGLKDKNGKEIYEGDILKAGAAMHGDAFLIRQCLPLTRTAWSYIERVGFWQEKKYHALGAKHGQTDIGYDDLLSFSEECEVIGNIYENPELIGD